MSDRKVEHRLNRGRKKTRLHHLTYSAPWALPSEVEATVPPERPQRPESSDAPEQPETPETPEMPERPESGMPGPLAAECIEGWCTTRSLALEGSRAAEKIKTV